LLGYVDQLKPYNVADGAGNFGLNIWIDLTSSIRAALLNKITTEKWNQWLVSSNYDSKPEFPGTQSALNFVFPRDSRTYASGVYGRERTDQAMDTSSHILAIISGNCSNEDWDEIIGEIQFAYLTGMLLGNLGKRPK
jgi:A1 cistron-splicing factor AAR2